MCLIIKKGQKFRKTRKDIIVYKHVYLVGNIIYSSYQNRRVGMIDNLPIHLTLDVEEVTIQMNEDTWEILLGFHSFINLSDCVHRAKYLDEIVIECVIPKGSWVIEGIFGIFDESSKSIVSTEIIYNKIVERYDREDN
jgi:hypothetical protein